jgi:thiamine biosynthesis protein ThiS
VKLSVNGTSREVAEGTSLADLLADLGVDRTGIAVALNDRVVRGAAFADQALREGDAVEIIRATAGG